MPSTDDHIADFLAHLALERNLSPRTLDSYGRDLHQFASWLAEEGQSVESVDRIGVTLAPIGTKSA